MSKLRVAAVQMNCVPGQVQRNRAHAEQWIQQAANRGSELVLLPELMPSGYMVTEQLWRSAETLDGPSVAWLRQMAEHFHVYLGFTFLQAEGEDFYNTFVLAGPDGNLLGHVRKRPPASIEAYFYRSGDDRHVIETELGRIGVSICYENLLYRHLCHLYQEKIDLLLAPAAAGRPKPFIPGDVKRFERMLVNARTVISQTLGVPVVTANRVGPLETELPGWLPYLKSSFPGLSSIVAADGTVTAALEEQEGVIVSEVEPGYQEDKTRPPRKYGTMWGIPVPWYSLIWPLTQKMGERPYRVNPRRKEWARFHTERRA